MWDPVRDLDQYLDQYLDPDLDPDLDNANGTRPAGPRPCCLPPTAEHAPAPTLPRTHATRLILIHPDCHLLGKNQNRQRSDLQRSRLTQPRAGLPKVEKSASLRKGPGSGSGPNLVTLKISAAEF